MATEPAETLPPFEIGAQVVTPTGPGIVRAYVQHCGEIAVPPDDPDVWHVVEVAGVRKDYVRSLLRRTAASVFERATVPTLRDVWKNTLRIHDGATIPKHKAEMVKWLTAHFDDYGLNAEDAVAEALEFGGEASTLAEVARFHAADD